MTSANNRWYLAIDRNCAFCDDVGTRLRPILEGRVTIASLHDEWVSELRIKHFGNRSTWAPTLISVDSKKATKLWVGKSMPMRLATVLGPKKAIQVVSMLGNLTTKTDKNTDTTSTTSRRGFMRQLAGVTAGLSMATGVGETVLADPPGNCGIYQTYGGYTSMTANYANCRHCPNINSPSAIGGSVLVGPIQFRYHAYGGGVPGSTSSLWWRTAGPTGCWVHSSAVY